MFELDFLWLFALSKSLMGHLVYVESGRKNTSARGALGGGFERRRRLQAKRGFRATELIETVALKLIEKLSFIIFNQIQN